MIIGKRSQYIRAEYYIVWGLYRASGSFGFTSDPCREIKETLKDKVEARDEECGIFYLRIRLNGIVLGVLGQLTNSIEIICQRTCF